MLITLILTKAGYYLVPAKKKILVCCLLLGFLSFSCSKDKPGDKELKEITGTCKPAMAQGQLTFPNNAGTFRYRTSGGGTILINITGYTITLQYDAYPNLRIEFWGGFVSNGQPVLSFTHENLNGKHIKDRVGANRTIVFPDGSKITMACAGEEGALLSVSIYDGAESHRINGTCITLVHSALDAGTRQTMDDAEADGETSTFEITPTGLIFKHIYIENTPGNKVPNTQKLGELNLNNPTQVQDFYDDPRLGHT